MDIKQWVARHVDCNTPVGDLARDMRRWPLEGSTLEGLVDSMRLKGACAEALGVLQTAALRAAVDAARCGAGCSALLTVRGKVVAKVTIMEDTGRLMVLQIELTHMGLRQVGWRQNLDSMQVGLADDFMDSHTVEIKGLEMRNLLASDINDFVLTMVFE